MCSNEHVLIDIFFFTHSDLEAWVTVDIQLQPRIEITAVTLESKFKATYNYI